MESAMNDKLFHLIAGTIFALVALLHGQKRKCRRFLFISALPHKADINCRHCEVRFVPLTDNERHEGPRPKPELVQSTRHDQTPFGSRRRAWSGSSLSAHSRNISALLGRFGSSTFWATSAPAIGRPSTGSKPTWTRTEA